MTLPLPPNCTFDVYRGYSASHPYNPPSLPAALVGQQGVLRHHVRNGRFGYVLSGEVKLYHTSVLFVSVGTDVRSQYNSEQNTFSESGGDTVMVYDYPVPGTCTAFVVVMVQRVGRGGAGDYLRCYLDRAQPWYKTACPSPVTAGETTPCCPGIALPPTLYATFFNNAGNCNCMAGTYALTWDSTRGGWATARQPLCNQVSSELMFLKCITGPPVLWTATSAQCSLPLPSKAATSCLPFFLQWTNVSITGSPCCSGNINVTITT